MSFRKYVKKFHPLHSGKLLLLVQFSLIYSIFTSIFLWKSDKLLGNALFLKSLIPKCSTYSLSDSPLSIFKCKYNPSEDLLCHGAV